MSGSNRDSFGSKLGVVLAAAGSAVGLGRARTVQNRLLASGEDETRRKHCDEDGG